MSGIKPMGTEMMHKQSRSPRDHGDFSSPYPLQGPSVVHAGHISEQEGGPFITVRPQTEQVHKFAGLGVGLAGVCAEHILSHPCIVLRRQCQVHHNAAWFHVTPFTLFPVIFNIQRNQFKNGKKSLTTMWKGIGSTLTVKGLAVASEAAISEFTPLPKEVNRHSSMKKLIEHLLLKGLGLVIITPFYAASLVETVQSEIASERPGVFDCLREGANRLLGWSSSHTNRLLPVYRLFAPTLLHGLSHYIITSLAHYTVLVSIRTEMQENKDHQNLSDSQDKVQYDAHYAELIATFTGNLLADTMLYPLETVLHRLCLQGTRTIIDNTDTGVGVMPIITRYESMTDCFLSIIREEGLLGLYKGFGALVLQYGLHVAIIKLTKFIFEHLSHNLPKGSAARAAEERARRVQPRPSTSRMEVVPPVPQSYQPQGYTQYGYPEVQPYVPAHGRNEYPDF